MCPTCVPTSATGAPLWAAPTSPAPSPSSTRSTRPGRGSCATSPRAGPHPHPHRHARVERPRPARCRQALRSRPRGLHRDRRAGRGHAAGHGAARDPHRGAPATPSLQGARDRLGGRLLTADLRPRHRRPGRDGTALRIREGKTGKTLARKRATGRRRAAPAAAERCSRSMLPCSGAARRRAPDGRLAGGGHGPGEMSRTSRLAPRRGGLDIETAGAHAQPELTTRRARRRGRAHP